MENVVAALVQALNSSKAAPDQVDLPIFHPEIGDAAKWIEQVEKIKNELAWSDVQVLVRVGRYLTQSARKWFDEWSPDIRDWINFKREFSDASRLDVI